MDASRLERAEFEVWYDRNRDDGPNMVLSRSMAEKAWFARAALDAAQEPAQAGEAAAEREVVDAAVDFATMSAPDAEEWGSIRVVRLGRLVNAVHALRGIRAAAPSRPVGAAPPAPDAALLERVAREAAEYAYDEGAVIDPPGRARVVDAAVARAIDAARGGAA